MGDTAIRVQNLSKRYYIGEARAPYRTLRDSLSRFLSRRSGGGAPAGREEIWALKDVSFEVKQGEAIGIIGRNGAGKTTLLKILSRITEPTHGSAEVHGRLGSLLEVGSGFHPELTGRENIYLNGAILGMKRAEIARKFDSIVSFAEIEKFLDTPVKFYSTGMYMRLAFAVAAHMEHDILLVDEVLAVGDTAFQKRCLSKVESIGKEGRTVFFVSHSMPAVTRLCQRAIWLSEGMIMKDGPCGQVVASYLGRGLGTNARREWADPGAAPGNEVVRLRSTQVVTEDGRVTDAVDIRKPIGIQMEFDVLKPGFVLISGIQCTNEEGIYIFSAHDTDAHWIKKPKPVGRYVSTAWIPGNFLSEGTVIVDVGINTMDPFVRHCFAPEILTFQVIDSLDGDSARGDYGGIMAGVVRPLLRWTTKFAPEGSRS